MHHFKAAVVALIITLLYGAVIDSLNWHGYYAGYSVASVLLLTYFGITLAKP